MRLSCTLAAAALLAGAPLAAQEACAPARTALVLSGGGAKGLAHVGVLRALDSLGVVPDLVVGTSMGAIVGSLYASGFTGREIDSIVRHAPGGSLVRSFAPLAPRSLGMLQPVVVVAEGEGVSGLQTSAVREREVHALLDDLLLLGNLRARGNFDSLPLPFRAVATDLHTRAIVTLGRGDLPRAVRASLAIPLVFAPEQLDGRWLADGGLSANVPVNVARSLGAERVIVSDVSSAIPDTANLSSTAAVAAKLLDFLFDQPQAAPAPGDVYVKHDVQRFAPLDFSPGRARELLDLGRAAADSVLGAAGCLRPLATGRHFRRLPLRVGAIDSLSDRRDRPAEILRDLGLRAGDSIDYPLLRQRVRRLASTDLVDAVWLYPDGDGDTVGFSPRVRAAPRLFAAGGFAYDNQLGGRVWLAVLQRDLLGLPFETSSTLYLGGLRDELVLAARRNYLWRWRLLAPTLAIRAANEKIRRFDGARAPLPDDEVKELVGFAGLEREYGAGWRVAVGAEGRLWREPTLRDGKAGGAIVRIQRFGEWTGWRAQAEAVLTKQYRYAFATARLPWSAGRLGGELIGRAGAGRDLPVQMTFQLGGVDAFPGVLPGELRGTRELSAQAALRYRLAGPLNVEVDGGVGRLTPVGDAPALTVSGIRAGVSAETPLGPLRMGYGWASDGRRAWFVRLLRWFGSGVNGEQ